MNRSRGDGRFGDREDCGCIVVAVKLRGKGGGVSHHS